LIKELKIGIRTKRKGSKVNPNFIVGSILSLKWEGRYTSQHYYY